MRCGSKSVCVCVCVYIMVKILKPAIWVLIASIHIPPPGRLSILRSEPPHNNRLPHLFHFCLCAVLLLPLSSVVYPQIIARKTLGHGSWHCFRFVTLNFFFTHFHHSLLPAPISAVASLVDFVPKRFSSSIQKRINFPTLRVALSSFIFCFVCLLVLAKNSTALGSMLLLSSSSTSFAFIYLFYFIFCLVKYLFLFYCLWRDNVSCCASCCWW